MRNFITLVENCFDLSESVAMQYMGKYGERPYPVYKNANSAVLQNTENGSKFGVRGLLDRKSGSVFFWDAYAAVHTTMRRELGLVEPIHLYLWPDSIVICSVRGAHSEPLTDDLIDIVAENRNIRRLYGSNPQVHLQADGADDS